MTMQTVTDAALRVAERFGVPVVILAAILWMTREAATSLHTSVVVPIVKSHTEFLEATSETLRNQEKTLREIAECQIEIREAVTTSGTARDK